MKMGTITKRLRLSSSFILVVVLFFIPLMAFGATESELFDAQILLANQQEISWFYFTQIVNLFLDLFFVYIILYVIIYKKIVAPLLKI